MEIRERGMDPWWKGRAVQPEQYLCSPRLSQLWRALDETTDLVLQDKANKQAKYKRAGTCQ